MIQQPMMCAFCGPLFMTATPSITYIWLQNVTPLYNWVWLWLPISIYFSRAIDIKFFEWGMARLHPQVFVHRDRGSHSDTWSRRGWSGWSYPTRWVDINTLYKSEYDWTTGFNTYDLYTYLNQNICVDHNQYTWFNTWFDYLLGLLDT
jgi:hypothetical protein